MNNDRPKIKATHLSCVEDAAKIKAARLLLSDVKLKGFPNFLREEYFSTRERVHELALNFEQHLENEVFEVEDNRLSSR